MGSRSPSVPSTRWQDTALEGGPNQRPTERETKTKNEKMEELNEFLAKLPPSVRWFCQRTRKPLPSLREVAPGEDQFLKTVVDGFEKLAFQN